MLPEDLPPISDLLNALDNYLNTFDTEQRVEEDINPEPSPPKPDVKKYFRFSKNLKLRDSYPDKTLSQNISEIKEVRLLIQYLRDGLESLTTQSLADQQLIHLQRRQIRTLKSKFSGLVIKSPEMGQQMQVLQKSVLRCEARIKQLSNQIESLQAHRSNIQNTIITNYPTSARYITDDELKNLASLIKQEIKYVTEQCPDANYKKLAAKAFERLQNDSKFSVRVAKALENGCREALNQMINHPIASFIIGFYEDWRC
ncbi:hypothetical protein IQ260_03435 [Leptolyngbya cf. ectocarpi LEGE 11479]|uniref:Uncharacterized protein n=1 Tax=Leptolyngbya cf. ectocarpi LEGE 11479 TaxID=1828722 RepID=A0A928WYB5_LEPEC|nr:hypothetical protein [Leptolyngbya ectocarpi]MBE9065700.1 hypothetical protein [Leptolyngbya cf. ectocarpi LEGE 11479]